MSNELAKTIMREVAQINRKSVFDDNATIEVDESDCTVLNLTLTPQAGLFANTSIHFTFEIPEDYPSSSPNPRCKEVLYHSNIGEDGSVCLNMFSEPDPSYRIEHYVNGLLWLLDNQNFDSQLNGYVTPNRSLFKANFKLACLGYEVGGLCPSRIYLKEPDRMQIVKELFAFHSIFRKRVRRKAEKVEEKAEKVEKVEEKVEKVEEKVEKVEEKVEKVEKMEEKVEKAEEKKEDEEPFELDYPEITIQQLLQTIASREAAHSEFILDQLPFLSLLKNSPSACFLWQRGPTTRASHLIRKFHLSGDSLLRPVVIKKGEELVLLITYGEEAVDPKALSAQFEGEAVEVPKAAQLKEKDPSIIAKLPFGWSSHVLIDSALCSSKGPLYIQTPLPNLILRAEAKDMLAFLKEGVWPKMEEITIPRDPPKEQKRPSVFIVQGEGKVLEEEKKEEQEKEKEEEEEKRREAEKKEERREEKREEKKEKEREKITCRTASTNEEAIEALPIVPGL